MLFRQPQYLHRDLRLPIFLGEEHRHVQALGLLARIPEQTLRAGAPGRNHPARVQRHERVLREAVNRGAENLVAGVERSDVPRRSSGVVASGVDVFGLRVSPWTLPSRR